MITLNIDVSTRAYKMLLQRFNQVKKLKITNVIGMGKYREDRTWSLITIDTELTENEIDNYLYNLNLPFHFDYGVSVKD